MMLADPGRVHAERIGIDRLGGDVGDELVGQPRIVVVVIVAEREIAEIHRILPAGASRDGGARGISSIVAGRSTVNKSEGGTPMAVIGDIEATSAKFLRDKH